MCKGIVTWLDKNKMVQLGLHDVSNVYTVETDITVCMRTPLQVAWGWFVIFAQLCCTCRHKTDVMF